MKILITGENQKNSLANAFARAFENLGCESVIFDEESLYRQLFPGLKINTPTGYSGDYFPRFYKKFLAVAGKEKPI